MASAGLLTIAGPEVFFGRWKVISSLPTNRNYQGRPIR